MTDRAIETVVTTYGIDPVVGPQRLIERTWTDGTVEVEGSMTPGAVPCSEAAYDAAMIAHASTVADLFAAIETNRVTNGETDEERTARIVAVAGNHPPPPGV